MCCYRESKNFDRFTRLTQSVVNCALEQLRLIKENNGSTTGTSRKRNDDKSLEPPDKCSSEAEADQQMEQTSRETQQSTSQWSQQHREKLLHLLSKIFLLNFPLYIAMKHGGATNPLAPVKVISNYQLFYNRQIVNPYF